MEYFVMFIWKWLKQNNSTRSRAVTTSWQESKNKKQIEITNRIESSIQEFLRKKDKLEEERIITMSSLLCGFPVQALALYETLLADWLKQYESAFVTTQEKLRTFITHSEKNDENLDHAKQLLKNFTESWEDYGTRVTEKDYNTLDVVCDKNTNFKRTFS